MPVVIPSGLNATHGLNKSDHGWPGTNENLLVSMWSKFDVSLWTNNFRFFFSDANDRIGVATNNVSTVDRFEQSVGYSSGFTRSNDATVNYTTNHWNHIGCLYTTATGATEWYVNGNRINRANTGTGYTAGALGVVHLFRRPATGLCAIPGLYADITAWSGGVAGISGTSHLLCQALAAGESPETTNPRGHTLEARNKFLDDLEGWTVDGGVITVEDNGDYPPVDDYLPAATGGHRSRARYNRAR